MDFPRAFLVFDDSMVSGILKLLKDVATGSSWCTMKLTQANITIDGVTRNPQSHMVLRVRPREHQKPMNHHVQPNLQSAVASLS